MSREEEYLIHLLRCSLYQRRPDPAPGGLDWERLYRLAHRHTVEVMVYYALLRLEHPVGEVLAKWKETTYRQVRKDITREYEMQRILDAFEKAGINCMPLKGFIIRKLYPKTEMRYMSDFDLLADPNQLDRSRAVLRDLGYEPYRYDSHHDIFYLSGFPMFVELHKLLIMGKLEEYFGIGFSRAFLWQGKRHIYQLSKEDYYIYLIGHMAYHFAQGGIGIRSVMDIRVYLDRYQGELDKRYLQKELEENGLWTFASHLEALSEVWFLQKEGSPFLKQVADYIMGSEVLGSKENSRILEAARSYREDGDYNAAKRKALQRMVFLPKDWMRSLYPALKKHPALLPFCHLHRWGKILINRKQNLRRLYDTATVEPEEIDALKQLYKGMGIDHL